MPSTGLLLASVAHCTLRYVSAFPTWIRSSFAEQSWCQSRWQARPVLFWLLPLHMPLFARSRAAINLPSMYVCFFGCSSTAVCVCVFVLLLFVQPSVPGRVMNGGTWPKILISWHGININHPQHNIPGLSAVLTVYYFGLLLSRAIEISNLQRVQLECFNVGECWKDI